MLCLSLMLLIFALVSLGAGVEITIDYDEYLVQLEQSLKIIVRGYTGTSSKRGGHGGI
jgi:hypothetical protein